MRRKPINLKRRVSEVRASVPGPSLAVAIFVGILIVTASVILASDPSPWHSLVDSWHHIGNVEFLMVFIVGGLSGMLLASVAQSGMSESAGCFLPSVRRTGLLLG